jgi:hypothetical protein
MLENAVFLERGIPKVFSDCRLRSKKLQVDLRDSTNKSCSSSIFFSYFTSIFL